MLSSLLDNGALCDVSLHVVTFSSSIQALSSSPLDCLCSPLPLKSVNSRLNATFKSTYWIRFEPFQPKRCYDYKVLESKGRPCNRARSTAVQQQAIRWRVGMSGIRLGGGHSGQSRISKLSDLLQGQNSLCFSAVPSSVSSHFSIKTRQGTHAARYCSLLDPSLIESSQSPFRYANSKTLIVSQVFNASSAIPSPLPSLSWPTRSRLCPRRFRLHSSASPSASPPSGPSPMEGDPPSSQKSPPGRRPWWLESLRWLIGALFEVIRTILSILGWVLAFTLTTFAFAIMERRGAFSQFQGPPRSAAWGGAVAASGSVPYSEFLMEVESDNVKAVEVDGEKITFAMREIDDVRQKRGIGPAMVTVRPTDMSTPYDVLRENRVEFGAPEKRSFHLTSSAAAALLYLGILLLVVSRLPLGSLTLPWQGRKKGSDRSTGVVFADVAGVDEAKEELMEVVEYLREPERFTALGARPPRGVLLVGPPGTGKTMLARAMAGEADVPFITCAGSAFVELYVGLGASRVRDLFARARKDAPAIIFIDEIDAVAKGRDGRLRGGANDEREQTLNQLLTEMDGFETGDTSGSNIKDSTVVVVAATNRPDVLDPALRRPGRFDRIVSVEAPDRTGREEILHVHVRRKLVPLEEGADLSEIAQATVGFTGAELANLVNEAALLAARGKKSAVGREELMQAVERSRGGIEKKRSSLGSSEKGVIARHEAGHALVGMAVGRILAGFPRASKLSIVPRTGGALGFTYFPPSDEERSLVFADEMRGHLVVLLGGRAAEEVAFGGRVSTGAMDDIRRATDMAYKAVAEYGLNAAVGPLSLPTLAAGGFGEGGAGGGLPWGGKDQGVVTELVEREVCAMLHAALEAARRTVRENAAVLEGLGKSLEEEEKIQGSSLDLWMDQVRAPSTLVDFLRVDQVAALPETSSLPEWTSFPAPSSP
eukprot:TRINITY_DN18798_c0_g1_i1.p1 TRINITY_DN18798_c0_g1~~TRINITY_DN18798_c0_g1_i1.p1  ORF type:complete len:938 (+),score=139.72 TRINITY_DN18798_c0_g1_i1:301-3114(+)